MKVFFSCSTTGIPKYKSYYRTTLQEIEKAECELTRDWLEQSITISDNNQSDIAKSQLYKFVSSAIVSADVVIFDCTEPSMALGHQITYAIWKNKPMLVVGKADQFDVNDSFIKGANSNLIKFRPYHDEEDLRFAISKFLNTHKNKEPKVRFDCYLEKKEIQYLEWATEQYDLNKTEIVRKGIHLQMENDNLYLPE